jgi:transcriptional regulator with XRE-family HTH domain
MSGKARPHPKPVKIQQPIKLHEWLTAKGKSQQQLADYIGISRVQVNRIATGKRQYTQRFLELAAEYLETTPSSLLMRDPTKEEALWTIWDQIAPEQKEQALKVIEVFVTPTSDKKAS